MVSLTLLGCKTHLLEDLSVSSVFSLFFLSVFSMLAKPKMIRMRCCVLNYPDVTGALLH